MARFAGDDLVVDTALQSRIDDIVRTLMHVPADAALPAASLDGIRKQAMVPEGAQVIPPVGTAPGVALPARIDPARPAVLVLPGPPRELQGMWPAALATPAVADALSGRVDAREETIRAFGLLEADLAATLRQAQASVAGFGDLEITTCLRRGEVEIVTRFPAQAAPAYADLAAVLLDRHGAQIFSTDGSTIDDQLAAALTGRRIATAESCTGGLIAARLTDRPGSSAYVMGGVVSYSNDAKVDLLDVPDRLIADDGAVSEPVAAAMAEGAIRRFGADVAISTTGIAGPGGGTERKPVGTVCFGVALADRPTVTTTLHLPGDRAAVRERATTIAMHLVADALRGVGAR